MPYATIYVEELQTGTCANQEGKFAIHVTQGKFTISFRSLGYTPVTQSVSVNINNIEMNVVLPFQSYILQGVTVRADDEDPAYSIMRKAISRAPGFINQVESYTSEVYIKGSVKINKIPKILRKRMEVNGKNPEEGETYVNESVNKIRFLAPDTYTQEVISVNNSFPIGENEVPVIGMISSSIYESQKDLYISPFSPNAFSYYTFHYEGLLQDGAWFIDKIKVTPKRKGRLFMEGYLYIVEDLWCLYSYEITLNPLYVELEMKQHYAPIKNNSYLPVNLFVKAKINAMGVKADGTYTTTIKYNSVKLNPSFVTNKVVAPLAMTDTITPKKALPKQQKVDKIDEQLNGLLKKEELSNREMVEVQKLMAKKAELTESDSENPFEIKSAYRQIVSKDALVRDSMYWDSIRPVPASTDEKFSYQKVEKEKEKEDSTSAFKKAGKIMLFGNFEWERSRKLYAYYPGLIDLGNIGFNPVDGWQVKQFTKIRIKTDSINYCEMKTQLGYAIDRNTLFGNTNIYFTYAPQHRGDFNLDAGYMANDYNNESGTPTQINSFYNLLLKENYIKFYHDKFIGAENRVDIVGGLHSTTGLKWQQTDTLNNSTNFSFFYPSKDYSVNKAVNQELGINDLNPTKLLRVRVGFDFTPKQYYRIYKGRRHNENSGWPTISITYLGALKVQSDYARFNQFEFGVRQDIDFYTVSNLSYAVNAGTFLNSSAIHFSSYKHFNTFEAPFTTKEFKNGFYLLHNYEYSTKKSYLEGHLKYSTQYLLLKNLPWLSNRLWTENLFASLLLVDGHRPYYEAGYSLGQLFFAGELGVFAGFTGSTFQSVGVRAVFKFN